MKLFGKKVTQEQIHRQAAEELDAALARAKPPTEAERTWVLPRPEAPQFGPRRRATFSPRTPPEPVEEAPARPARKRPPVTKAAGAKAAGKKSTGRAKPVATTSTAKRSTRAKTGS